MNIKEFDNVMHMDDIQPACESYQDMLDANEAVIESFENLLKEYENTETRINENYYNSDIKEAVNEKAVKVKKGTTKIVDKLKNQRAYLKRKIHSKVKKSKKECAKLEEFKDKAKDVDFKESTIILKRYNSGRQTESFVSTMESTIGKMNKLMESYYNTNDKKYLDKFNKVHSEYKELFEEACEYLNTTSEVRLNSALVESAVNILLSENSNTLELRKEYDNLMGKLQTKARYNGKVLESFSDANAAQMSVYPAMIDTYQFKISKLNSDVANAKKIIEAAAQFDDNLYDIMYDDNIQPYQEMVNMNQQLIETYENLSKYCEDESITEAVNGIVSKLKNQHDNFMKNLEKRKINSNNKSSAKFLSKYAEKASHANFNGQTVTLFRFKSDKQTNAAVKGIDANIKKMEQILAELGNENISKERKKELGMQAKALSREHTQFIYKVSKTVNTKSEVKLTPALVKDAINTIKKDRAEVVRMANEYQRGFSKLEKEAAKQIYLLQGFSPAKATLYYLHGMYLDKLQYQVSKLNADYNAARKILKAAAKCDQKLKEALMMYENPDIKEIQESYKNGWLNLD